MSNDEQKIKAQEIALKHTKAILKDLDITEQNYKHPKYSQLQYELQFEIYHAIKKTLKI